MIPSTLVFAELVESPEQTDACIWATKFLLEEPDSVYYNCDYKLECEGYKPNSSNDKITMYNDYTVKQFLKQNPNATIDNMASGINGASMINHSFYGLRDLDSPVNYPSISIQFDVCSNINRYNYYPTGNGTVGTIYPVNDTPEEVAVFNKEHYEIIKAIMQRHPPLKIQRNEFNILPNDTHCNDGLELHIRDNTIPVCIKEQTYETLLERGFNFQYSKMQSSNGIIPSK